MKSEMFKEISIAEKRAKLLLTLVNKTQGKFSKEQLENIVAEINLDIQGEYIVNVVKNAKAFGKVIVLKDQKSYGYENDDPVLMGHLEDSAKILVGKNLEFGKKEKWFDDGYEEDADEEIKQCNFCIDSIYAIEKHRRYDWEAVTDDYSGIHWEKHYLIIYLPSKIPYEVDKEIQYVLNNFNIK